MAPNRHISAQFEGPNICGGWAVGRLSRLLQQHHFKARAMLEAAGTAGAPCRLDSAAEGRAQTAGALEEAGPQRPGDGATPEGDAEGELLLAQMAAKSPEELVAFMEESLAKIEANVAANEQLFTSLGMCCCCCLPTHAPVGAADLDARA